MNTPPPIATHRYSVKFTIEVDLVITARNSREAMALAQLMNLSLMGYYIPKIAVVSEVDRYYKSETRHDF